MVGTGTVNSGVEKNKYRLPKIGMRIVKSAVAVGICLFISYIFKIEEPPLIATIGTIICMQKQMSESMKTSFLRMFGTATGALLGFLTTFFWEIFSINDLLPRYISVTFMIVVVFYTSLLLKQSETGGLSCIAFLCTTISIGTISPFEYAIKRGLETFMGISVSLAVNRIHLPRKKERDFLFVTKFDQILYKSDDGITPYSTFELNLLIEKGVPFTLVTGRTPAFLHEHIKNVSLNLPVVTMDGAVLYDMERQHHLICRSIYVDLAKDVIKKIEAMNLNFYAYSVFEDVMFIYHKEFKNKEEARLYETIRNSPYRHYVYGDPHYLGEIVCISLVVTEEICNEVETIIKAMDKRNELIFVKDGMELTEGYRHLKIYDHTATKNRMMQHLLERTPQKKSIIFGGNHNDRNMMQNADFAYAIESSPREVKVVCDGKIRGDDNVIGDKVLKEIHRIAHPFIFKPIPKYIKNLKMEILEDERKILEETLVD